MLIAGSLIALSLFGATPCPSLTPVPDHGSPHGHLACADLAGAHLVRADLTGADLHGADLTGADLSQADLRGADLTQADLSRADLRGADLADANLTQADISGADLRGATLAGTSAVQATGLLTVRVDRVGPGAYVQVGYLLLGPAAALALAWARRRWRHPRRLAGVVVAVAGLYLLCTGALRGLAAAVTGWLWAVDPGPVGLNPLAQLAFGAVALVVAAFPRYVPRRPVGEPAGHLAIGRPTPGPRSPSFGPRTRGVLALAGGLGLLDVGVVFVLWLLDLLPARGPWGAASVPGHLVVVGVAAVCLVRGARAPADAGTQPVALTGIVLAAPSYVWLSGTSAGRRPANRAVPWESLEHVHLVHTLGATAAGTAMFTIRPPGAAEPVEYPDELPVTGAQADRLRAILPSELVTEVARAQDGDSPRL
ncbi:pentapeptide repeat-containing protein [Actinophytocola sp.]|uniref:pentapeptide repeat-containing protein n=1 Tax=Actinophytocola sp. TaxID=1872138 RepID=UPI00389A3410